MEPAFKTISDLFAVVPADNLDIPDNPRKKEGKTAEESEDLGRQCLSEGDFQAAIKHFKTAIAQRPADDITAMVDLAGAYDYGLRLRRPVSAGVPPIRKGAASEDGRG